MGAKGVCVDWGHFCTCCVLLDVQLIISKDIMESRCSQEFFVGSKFRESGGQRVHHNLSTDTNHSNQMCEISQVTPVAAAEILPEPSGQLCP